VQRTTGLSDAVRGLAARDGVEAVLLASADGLPIDHASSISFDPETVAALAATLAQHLVRLGDGAERGELTVAAVEYEGGIVVLRRLPTGDWLAIFASNKADIGPLLHDVRAHGPALVALL
jgi:predicted regulator of Ras-like GTPase activity (Roadblock/LC7/MglB family)